MHKKISRFKLNNLLGYAKNTSLSGSLKVTHPSTLETIDTLKRIENELALLLDSMNPNSDYDHYNKVKRMLNDASIKRIQLEINELQ